MTRRPNRAINRYRNEDRKEFEMNINWDSREVALTATEFKALERNGDGDIIELSYAYPFITDAQRDGLTGDDQSRMHDLDEEVRCLMADLMEEFC